MSQLTVHAVVAKLFDELKLKFPNAKQVTLSAKPPDRSELQAIPETPGLLLSDCHAAVMVTKSIFNFQMAIITAPNIDPSTFVQGQFGGTMLLVITAGPFRTEKPIWEIGKGYLCRDYIKIQTGNVTLSAFLPAVELCGFLIARLYQLVQEMRPKRQEVWEHQLWPNGDYDHRPEHLPPPEQQKG
ncbi:MAG: hypothetical protein Q7S15_01860 [bacterium]|nr:hypothetical protein [bacterium]